MFGLTSVKQTGIKAEVEAVGVARWALVLMMLQTFTLS